MIEVRYKGRLGNNLFQYVLGRILAEQLGFELRAEEIGGFPNTALEVRGERHLAPEVVLKGNVINLKDTLANRSPRKVILDGWFQRFEYYKPYRRQIQDWLAMNSTIKPCAEKADLVLQVRRTDYVALGWALPFSYFEEAIDLALPKGGSIAIVTDDSRDPFFHQFRRWPVRFVIGSPLEQFAYLVKAPRLVMSQSSFSWWPAFLGEHQKVIAPITDFGVWAENGAADPAKLVDPEWCIPIKATEKYVPSAEEVAHQKWRAFKRRVVLKMNRVLGLSFPEPPP